MSTRIFILLVVAIFGCDTRQNFEMPEWTDSRMLVQPRYEPYGESRFFDDGMTMRAPVPGTIATDDPLLPEIFLTGQVDGKDVLRIPVPVTHALLEKGKSSFEVVCATCHGLLGDGNSVVATKMQDRPPPSLHDPAIAALAPGTVFRVATLGYGLMMPTTTLLSTEERWAVVAYVKALTLSQAMPLTMLSANERSRLEALP